MKLLPTSDPYGPACLEPRAKPDVPALMKLLEQDAADLSDYVSTMLHDHHILTCYWDGQSLDGRKHKDDLGKDPDTWEDGPDARVPLAKLGVNETVLVMLAALRAARLTVTPLNPQHQPDAALVAPVLKYVLENLMSEDMHRQPQLWAHWSEAHVCSFLYVGWKRTRSLEEKQLTRDQLLQWAVAMRMEEVQGSGFPVPGAEAQAPEQAYVVPEGMNGMEADQPSDNPPALPSSNTPPLPSSNTPPLPSSEESALHTQLTAQTSQALLEMILDPQRRRQLIAVIMAYDPAVEPEEAARVATALKAGKPGTYFAPYTKESRPEIRACQAGIDLLIPRMTEDVQRSPRMALLPWLGQSEVMDRAHQNDWPDGTLELVLASPGRAFGAGVYSEHDWFLSGTSVGAGMTQEHAAKSGQYQFIELYHTCMTTGGVPCTYVTLLHHSVADQALEHRVQTQYHGRLPLVPLSREARHHQLLAGQSLPGEAQSWQQSLKDLEDGIAANTQLRTTPPYGAPASRFSEKKRLPIAPFCQVPTASGKNFEWLPLPADAFQAERREEALFARACRQFGLAHKDVPDSVTQLWQQHKANNFLHAMSSALQLIFQLCQQFLEPIIGAQVAGLAAPLNATREQIQGQFRFLLSFNIRHLDPDAFMAEMELLSKMAIPFDSEGRIDRGELVEYIFSSMMPQMTPRLIKPKQQAATDTVSTEKQAMVWMLQGVEPADPHGGDNAGALQELQRLVNTNPKALAIMQAPEAQLDPQSAFVRQLIDNRVALHTKFVNDDKSRIIGRQGAMSLTDPSGQNAA